MRRNKDFACRHNGFAEVHPIAERLAAGPKLLSALRVIGGQPPWPLRSGQRGRSVRQRTGSPSRQPLSARLGSSDQRRSAPSAAAPSSASPLANMSGDSSGDTQSSSDQVTGSVANSLEGGPPPWAPMASSLFRASCAPKPRSLLRPSMPANCPPLEIWHYGIEDCCALAGHQAGANLSAYLGSDVTSCVVQSE